MSLEDKVKEQNRIRQLAFKVREKMPKDYRSYCLVAAHLVRNAHRYHKEEVPENVRAEIIKEENTLKLSQSSHGAELETDSVISQDANKLLREIRTLKHQNRIIEQQERVLKLKKYGSYRDLKKITGVPLKTLHDWCSEPKERKHKATVKSQLKREEFIHFLLQDTISFSHPCKRYAGKKFLMHTWEEVYKRYLQKPQFHKH